MSLFKITLCVISFVWNLGKIFEFISVKTAFVHFFNEKRKKNIQVI